MDRKIKPLAPTDKDLVEATINGNAEAFGVIFKKYYKSILRIIFLRTQEKTLAEDIVQEAFIRAFKSITSGKYIHDGRIDKWITRIAINIFTDTYRKKKRVEKTMGKMVSINSQEYNNTVMISIPDTSLDWLEQKINGEAANEVRNLLKSLPEKERIVVVLRHYADIKFKDISIMLGIPIPTATGMMRRARIKLRAKVESDSDLKISLTA